MMKSLVFVFAFLWRFVGFVQNLHEVLGHIVRLLQGPVVSFQVLHCKTGKVLEFFCGFVVTKDGDYSRKQRKSVSTHMLYTLKNP